MTPPTNRRARTRSSPSSPTAARSRCAYCSNPLDLARTRRELRHGDWPRVFAEAAALGVLQVNLTGGEPLVRADLEALVAAARAQRALRQPDHQRRPRRRARGSRAGGGRARQPAALGAGHRPARRRLDRRARRLEAKLEVAAGGARARPAAHAQRRPPPRQHRARRGVRRAGRAARRRAAGAGQHAVPRLGAGQPRRAAAVARASSSARARSPRAARERLRGRMEILFVRPDYYADRPRACMDGWARRYLVVTPDGVVLPCHQATQHRRPRRSRTCATGAAAIWNESPAFRASAARTGCRSPAAPATSATRFRRLPLPGVRAARRRRRDRSRLRAVAPARRRAGGSRARRAGGRRRPPRRMRRINAPAAVLPRTIAGGMTAGHLNGIEVESSPRSTARSRRSAASVSPSAPGRSSGSSGRTGRARRPPSRSCARCCSRRRGARAWPAWTSRRRRATCAAASASSSRTRRWTTG